MIEPKELRLSNLIIDQFGRQLVIDEDEMEVLMAVRNWVDIKPVILTKEILKNNLGFSVHDMGDYWQAELGEFVMIQPRFAAIELPWILGFKVLTPRSIKIQYVHQLQNIYQVIEQKDLIWTPSPKTAESNPGS